MAVRKPGKAGGSVGKAVTTRTGKSGRFVETAKTDRTGKSVAASALSADPKRGRSVKTLAATTLRMAPTMRMPRVDMSSMVEVHSYARPKGPVTASTTLKKAGGSLVMTLPAAVRRALGLVEGAEMSLAVDGSRVIMEPVATVAVPRFRKPKYTLEELVAGMNPDAPLTDEEREWMDAPAMGREVW